MNLPRSVRVLIALAALVLSLAALLLLLSLGEATLNIRARLSEMHPYAGMLWWGLLGTGGLLVGWLMWRILRSPRPRMPDDTDRRDVAPSAEQIEVEIERAEQLGADTATIRRELEELQRRRESGQIHVALFGEISTGKSSLIKALLPDAEIQSDVRGGTTRELRRYSWQSPAGDCLVLTDMPGTAEVGAELDRLSTDEATRAHIVLYVTDGDLNRSQHAALSSLLALGKPLLLVLNKTDRFDESETRILAQRLGGLLEGHPQAAFVAVSSASTRRVIRQLPDGSEREELRTTAPKVAALAGAMQRIIDDNQQILDRLRDSATFVLVSRQLDEAIMLSRRAKAEALVDGYAVKAVIGALAAITPGSDLLIQGYLGTQLVRELAELYDTKVGKVDTQLLLKLVQQHVGRAHTLLLAVAGNALKAFPGIGTLAGGALHAIAYGIIFRTLGRALTSTLETRGELHPRQAARLFEENLGEDLETSARDLAGLVVQQIRSQRGKS